MLVLNGLNVDTPLSQLDAAATTPQTESKITVRRSPGSLQKSLIQEQQQKDAVNSILQRRHTVRNTALNAACDEPQEGSSCDISEDN